MMGRQEAAPQRCAVTLGRETGRYRATGDQPEHAHQAGSRKTASLRHFTAPSAGHRSTRIWAPQALVMSSCSPQQLKTFENWQS